MKRLALALMLVATRARAGDPAAAKQLFEEGREALLRGDPTTACAKFVASNELDRKVGTLLNLAQCEESRARLLEARKQWQAAAELAHALGDPRESVARERLAGVDKRMPHLRVDLDDAPPGAVLTCDGVRIEPTSMTTVDPGAHQLSVTAPGHRSASTTITLAEGEERRLLLRPGPSIEKPTTEQPPAREVRADHRWTWVFAGSAVAATGLGAWFGASAMRRNNDSKHFCQGNACTEQGLELRDGALRDARWSTVAFVTGGLCLGGAVIAWSIERRAPVTVAVTPWSVSMVASW